jgi:hypothetical protein
MRKTIPFFIIIFIHLTLLSCLSFFPYPELFVYPYLAENGLLPYKQIFDQHLPSFLMMPINFYDFGLRNEVSAKLFLLASVLVSHIIIYAISKILFKGKKLILLPNILYLLTQPLFEGYILWIDSFLAPLLLFSYYLLLNLFRANKQSRTISPRFSRISSKSLFTSLLHPWNEIPRFSQGLNKKTQIFLLGLILGLTLFFKQVMLPLVMSVTLFYYVKDKSKMNLSVIILGIMFPLTLTLLWIVKRDILPEFFYWTISFNFKVYADMAEKLPSLSQLLRFFIFWVPPLVWSITKLKNKHVFLLLIFSVLSLFTAFTRFEFIHLQPSLPFIVLVSSYLLFSSINWKKSYFALMIVFTIIWWSFLLKNLFLKPSRLFTEDVLSVSQKIDSITKENEKIFVLGTQPVVYLLSNRMPAGDVFSVNLPWNMAVVEEKVYSALRKDPPIAVVRDSSSIIDGQRIIDFTPKINSFINDNYKQIDKIGENEILIVK